MLQKRLLQEHQASLAQLVFIAEQWQAADSAQAAFGSESTEYVRQAAEYNRESTESIRKTSDYKHQIKENWKQDRQTNDRRSPIDECQGCGAQRDKMHNRDKCPAANRECYNCDIKGHFGRVCKKPPRPRNGVSKVAETHGGSTDPTPMMRGVKVFPRGGGVPFTFEMCPDTGCTMTLISEDVVARQGLTVDTRSLKLDNSGTVTFGIKFQGKTTEVIALVSSSIRGEVLLSWQVLQKLGVIKSDFHNVEERAAVVSTEADVGLDMQEARMEVIQIIKEFDPVFNKEGPLRTMKGDPMKIHIKPDVKIIPLNVCTPRKTPIAYREAAKHNGR